MKTTLVRALAILLILSPEMGWTEDRPATQEAELQRLLQDAFAEGEFSGVVVAARAGKVVFRGAVGSANLSWKIPNQPGTKFRICSITKQFTALLVMQLVEEGKIKLDAPLTDYLTDFRAETGGKISVRNLLMNASGLPELPDGFYRDEDPKMADASFVVRQYLQGDLLFEPGTKFNYTNSDYFVLGELVAQLSGKSFEETLQKRILQPLGMNDTGLLTNALVLPQMAEGYTWKEGKFSREAALQIENFGASGAMYSTVDDLLVWDQALLTHRLLSEASTAEMFTADPKLGYVALGSWSYSFKTASGPRQVVERQGHINGFSALNVIVPEENLALIFLGNVDTQSLFQTYTGKGLSAAVLRALLNPPGSEETKTRAPGTSPRAD